MVALWLSQLKMREKIKFIKKKQKFLFCVEAYLSHYHNDPSSEEQSDQGLHCLPFRLHLLDSLITRMVEPHCSNFRVFAAIFSGVQVFRNFMVCNF